MCHTGVPQQDTLTPSRLINRQGEQGCAKGPAPNGRTAAQLGGSSTHANVRDTATPAAAWVLGAAADIAVAASLRLAGSTLGG